MKVQQNEDQAYESYRDAEYEHPELRIERRIREENEGLSPEQLEELYEQMYDLIDEGAAF